MNLLLVVDDYLPNSIKVGAKMMHELAVEFVHQGHHVTVVTPDATIDTKFIEDKLDGVRVWRFKNGDVKTPSKLKRAIFETMLSHNAFKHLKEQFTSNTFDYIVYYSPSIFFGPLVGRLKKLYRCNSYLIMRDFFPQWVIDQGIISPNSPITYYFRYFEKLNYKAADTIGIQSPKNLEYFKAKTKTDARLEVLYNWANHAGKVTSTGRWRKELGLENKVIFFYGGNMGVAQDMMNIVRLAKRLQYDDRVHFLLVGSGDEVEMIQEAMDVIPLENMTLLPAVNQEVFKEMLSEIDVGLFTLHKDHETHNFPGKLLGYMVQSLPILGSINPGNDIKPTIENANAGFISINTEDKILYENALRYVESEVLRKQMGQNAFRLLNDKFSVKSAVQTILKNVKEMV